VRHIRRIPRDSIVEQEGWAREAVLGYESYRAQKGQAGPSLWRERVTRAGISLPPAPELELGDAWEEPAPSGGST
jgi:hypothetical protein